MSEEVDIHDFKVIKWLSDSWGERFLGWTLNENDNSYAIFLRIPAKYTVHDKLVEATEEQKFFNEVRFPVQSENKAITLFLKRAGAIIWDKDNDFFSRSEEKIKDSLASFPAYFQILNDVLCGRLTCAQAKDIDSSVIEIWD